MMDFAQIKELPGPYQQDVFSVIHKIFPDLCKISALY